MKKRGWSRREQRNQRRIHSERTKQRNHQHVSNEDRALRILRQEAIKRFHIFDGMIYHPELDKVGIDAVVYRMVRVREGQRTRNRQFRLFIQHKSGESYRKGFEFRSPCVIVWVVDETTDPSDALIDLLQSIIKWLEIRSHKMADFFNEKLQELLAVREKIF